MWTTRSMLAVESFFPQSYSGFSQPRYIGNYWFFKLGVRNNCFCFWPYNQYLSWTGLARPIPAMTLFDGLFLKQIKLYEVKVFTQHGHWLHNCYITLWKKVLNNFGNCSVFWKVIFAIFLYVSAFNLRSNWCLLKSLISHEDTSQMISKLL